MHTDIIYVSIKNNQYVSKKMHFQYIKQRKRDIHTCVWGYVHVSYLFYTNSIQGAQLVASRQLNDQHRHVAARQNFHH